MAYKFDFKDVYAEMEIAGNSYKVDCNSLKVVNAMNDFAENCETLANDADITGEERVADAGMRLMETMIDTVLGERETARIFAGRVKNYNDMYDLSMFLCDSVNNARNARYENRAQRRGSGHQNHHKRKHGGK